MNSLIWRLNFLAAFAGLAMLGRVTPVFAAEGRDEAVERLERLEQRVNQMAEHQEQLMRQVGSQMERLGATVPVGRENMRQPMLPQPGIHPPMLPAGAPPAAKHMKAISDALGLLFLIGIICNILMAIWIFTDIRKRGEGPAIFVAMALVAGIPAAIIYSLVRLGDKKASAP